MDESEYERGWAAGWLGRVRGGPEEAGRASVGLTGMGISRARGTARRAVRGLRMGIL